MTDNIENNEAQMVSAPEAAKILGVSIATFRRRLADGTIPLPRPELGPYLKRPRSLKFDRADVERLKENPPRVEAS